MRWITSEVGVSDMGTEGMEKGKGKVQLTVAVEWHCQRLAQYRGTRKS
jgi:hypothetical protein